MSLFLGLPGAIGPMTLSSGFTSPSGASPQSTNSPTVTVPNSNSGVISLGLNGTPGTVQYSINGAAFVTFINGDTLTMSNGQTLQFKQTGATKTAVIVLTDQTVGTTCGSFTITNT